MIYLLTKIIIEKNENTISMTKTLSEYSGWYTFHLSLTGYLKMFLFVWIGYLIVMVLDLDTEECERRC